MAATAARGRGKGNGRGNPAARGEAAARTRSGAEPTPGQGFVLAIDEGTTGVTALVLGEDRSVAGRAYVPVAVQTPRPGWVEQDAVALLDATFAAARQALRSAKAANANLAGIGIANQRETTIVWDRRTGTPVAPAIVWQDRRTAARCDALRPDWQSTVRRRTGLVVDPYFCATKLEWLLARPGVRRRAESGDLAFGTVESWLAWNLTGRHVTDPTNASRTLLWDIHKGDWDAELLELFGVPQSMLPEVVPSAGRVGEVKALGGAPLSGLVGDQQSALLGQGCTRAGQAKNTYGTGCFLLQDTGPKAPRSRNGLITTRAAATDGRPRFALEGSVFMAGALVQWLRDQVGMVETAQEVDALASQVPDSLGVHIVPAFTGLGAPYWDAHARGAILGLTRGADRRHLARAALDAIALQTAELVGAMERDSGLRIPALRVDGGAARSDPLLQTQADLLQRPVQRPANVETTAMGAGILAGHACGLWDATEAPPIERTFEPEAPAAQARSRLRRWRQAVRAVRSFPAAP